MELIFSNNNIPKSLIYKITNHSMSFINPSPFKNTFHIIVAPIKQYEFISEMNKEELHDFFILIHTITKEIKSDGFTLNIQDGKAAGSKLSHVHMHIISRNINDGINHMYVLDNKNLKVNF